MKKLISGGIASLLVAAVIVIGSQAASSAEGEGIQVTATDVLYTTDDCFTSDVTVTGLDPLSQDGYDIEVTSPDGAWVDSEYAYGQTEDFFSALLCVGSDPKGTYTIEVNGVAYGTFEVRQPHFTRHRLGKRTMGGRLWINGHGMRWRWITVQVWSGGWWDVLDIRTNRYGQFGVYCKKHHRCPESFRFDYKGFVHSTSFHLYTGRRNGREALRSYGAALGALHR